MKGSRMSHDTHTASDTHKELSQFGNSTALMRAVSGWKSPWPVPKLETYKLEDGRKIKVVRDDLMEYGTKARAGAAVLNSPGFAAKDTIVYVQPRVGWAGLSLAELCRRTGKRLILFCPASAKASNYQLACRDRGAELRFVRIAAMPVLNKIARDFAERHGYLFFPLGLAVPEAVAGIAAEAKRISYRPKEVWCAVSTGVLIRGLEVAWPHAKFFGVAVARNIKDGEKGPATIFSHPRAFLQDAQKEEMPPYPSASNYDAKVWKFVVDHACDGALVWNVAGQPPEHGAQDFISNREWGDYSDVNIP